MTDDRLKAALAKMLPDTLEYYHHEENPLWWETPKLSCMVLDTELIHLCATVSRELPDHLFTEYTFQLAKLSVGNTCSGPREKDIYEPAWQQRVTALAKIKNIEI